ncbi:MAG: calcium-binding protein [Rhizobiaceae bacterium]|nr:calcium-binding protein [Rhizobiaceae bacterium]
MATLKTTGGALPGDDYVWSLGELIFFKDADIVGTPTTSTVRYKLDNGYVVKLSGTGLALDGAEPIGGTLTGLQVLMPDGTTPIHTLTGLSRSFAAVGDQADFYATDAWQLTMWLLSGNDTLTGSNDGFTDMFGGHGTNTYNAGTAGSHMGGGSGVDTYKGNTGYDIVSFTDSHYDATVLQGVTVDLSSNTAIDPWGNKESLTLIDEVRGTQFGDTLKGSNAAETFMGLGGRDNIDGGGGFDVVRYDRDERRGGDLGVTVDLAAETATDGFGRKDTIKNIEGVRGTNQIDKLYGSDVYNDLRGLAGNDWLDGRGDGDSMAGGEGDDTYVVDSVNDFVEENRDNGNGVDTVRSTITIDLADTDHFRGEVENVVLLGTKDLAVDGNALKNAITGNSGANTLRGADGDDTISGGDGADKISGGRGNDKLAGNAGADSYYFGNALSATTNVDTISGFSSIDSLYLSKAIFTQAGPVGELAAAAFTANADGAAKDASDRIIYETDTGIVRYDADGNGSGAAIVFAVLTGNPALTSADIFIY